MADEESPGGAGRRVAPPERLEPVPLTELQLAQRALATQGKAPTLAEALTDEQRAALVATLDGNDLATGDELDAAGEVLVAGTGTVVTQVLREYYEANKAVVDDLVADNE
jgi:hypothetical protein